MSQVMRDIFQLCYIMECIEPKEYILSPRQNRSVGPLLFARERKIPVYGTWTRNQCTRIWSDLLIPRKSYQSPTVNLHHVCQRRWRKENMELSALRSESGIRCCPKVYNNRRFHLWFQSPIQTGPSSVNTVFPLSLPRIKNGTCEQICDCIRVTTARIAFEGDEDDEDDDLSL